MIPTAVTRIVTVISFASIVVVLSPSSVSAQFVVVSSFNPSEVGSLCSIGFDDSTGNVWVFGCFGSTVQEYSSDGVFQSEIAHPGESVNDVDIDFATEALTLGATSIPTDTLLFINGETGPAEIYAVNKVNGSIIATLNSAFGGSHVVGGAYHPGRDTLFLVQDRLGGGGNNNMVAEIDPNSGIVLNTFKTTDSGYTINFGDIDVSATTGNLFVVSSQEATIAEFTPTGTLVKEHALPVGVSSLSGIAIDDMNNQAWVSGTGGVVWLLDGLPVPCPGDTNGDGVVNMIDFVNVSVQLGSSDPDADLDGSGIVDGTDLNIVFENWLCGIDLP